MARARCPRSRVEAGQKCVKIQARICCRLRCVDAYDQQKDLNSAEMDTLTKSCSPTIITTANGEVQTHEEATVYVKRVGYVLDYESLR